MFEKVSSMVSKTKITYAYPSKIADIKNDDTSLYDSYLIFKAKSAAIDRLNNAKAADNVIELASCNSDKSLVANYKINQLPHTSCIENPNDTWQLMLDHLRQRYGELVFQNWLKNLTFSGINNKTLYLTVPTKFIRELVLANYFDEMLSYLIKNVKDINKLDIRVESSKVDDKSINLINISKGNGAENSTLAKSNFYNNNSTSNQYPKQLVNNLLLNNKFTFNSFIHGKENEVAYFAAKQLAEMQSSTIHSAVKSLDSFNSLYIYGMVGMGKTHLLQSIANHIVKNYSSAKIAYYTAERFTQQYVSAVKRNNLLEFKEQLGELDILLLDDLQLICGRNSTEKEFTSTFDMLIESSKRVVIACDRSPYMLNLDSRTKSRLAGCISASIAQADFDLRFKILKHKACLITDNFNDSLLELIAGQITSSVRELEGMLYKIVTYCKLSGTNINIDIVYKLLNEYKDDNQLFDSQTQEQNMKKGVNKSVSDSRLAINNQLKADKKADKKASIPVEKVLNIVSQELSIDISDFISRKKSNKFSLARQISSYLLKEHTDLSLKEIGEKLGGRNYSTIIYLLGTFKKSLNKLDSKLNECLSEIRKKLLA